MSSSSKLYIPVHRREPSPGSASSTKASLPAHSLSPLPHDSSEYYPLAFTHRVAHTSCSSRHTGPIIYTPSDMLLLASSPLSKLSLDELNTLRAVAPEIVQSQRQRRTHEWSMSFGPYWPGNPRRRPQFPLQSHLNTSESEGEGQRWRK
ncbi:uncharacterized protein F5147DRAFT_236486 [Suillus discolor]|uniref:Uncharacterized protein n=1 Tax=Suillus discolor TaxID=1912936 RepID=A0A9P7JSY5_9AGAM|nr:uncharacterized protein F5147DRAFT_236486 [Suillus discolor]KAG2105757.1 hypothetical protein F5147DRAFT_236486 [Suillus discolor]